MKVGLIYCYTYVPTQEKYIGQTTNFKKRQKEHLTENRVNLRFHNLLRKHYDNFNIDILEDNIPLEKLNEREKYYIQFYQSYEKGFNLTTGGDGGFEPCQKYWEENPEKMKEHIKKIQPLAAKASTQWKITHPKEAEKNIKKAQEAAKKWREDNPEKFKENTKKAQEAAKEWRKNNPEKIKENAKKAAEKSSKKVRLLNTGEEFPSASEAGRQYNIPPTHISACCRGVRKSAGKSKKGDKLIWIYI